MTEEEIKQAVGDLYLGNVRLAAENARLRKALEDALKEADKLKQEQK